MARRLNNSVTIKVDRHYFDNIFEPERKRLSRIKKIQFTQREFTAFLAKSKARIHYPKPSMIYAPKKRKGGFRFTFDL